MIEHVSPEDSFLVWVDNMEDVYDSEEWEDMIDFELSLGLRFIDTKYDDSEDLDYYHFKIVDREKFFLFKIKYGL